MVLIGGSGYSGGSDNGMTIGAEEVREAPVRGMTRGAEEIRLVYCTVCQLFRFRWHGVIIMIIGSRTM